MLGIADIAKSGKGHDIPLNDYKNLTGMNDGVSKNGKKIKVIPLDKHEYWLGEYKENKHDGKLERVCVRLADEIGVSSATARTKLKQLAAFYE